MLDLYKMKLHESTFDTNLEIKMAGQVVIVRVPGGWVYESAGYRSKACVFVPYNNEFQSTARKTE